MDVDRHFFGKNVKFWYKCCFHIMSPQKYFKKLSEPEFGRTKKIYVWEHGDMYSKCHEIHINPNQLRTWNTILTYLTNTIGPVFGAIRKLVSIKTKKCINCFKDLENNGKYIAVGLIQSIKFSAKQYKTESEVEMETTMKKAVKRFYSGEMGESEIRFLRETQKRNLTIIFVLANGTTCQHPTKVVLTEKDLSTWDVTLAYLSNILDIPAGIKALYTIYGDVILHPLELQHGFVYVALAHNEKFVAMDYMQLFAEWQESSNKKGLLSSIKPASKKSTKDAKVLSILTDEDKKELMLDEKKSYTVPDGGDGINVQCSTMCKCVNAKKLAKLDQATSKEPIPVKLKCVQTQTTYKIQDNTVEMDSRVVFVMDVDNKGKFADNPESQNGSRDSNICDILLETNKNILHTDMTFKGDGIRDEKEIESIQFLPNNEFISNERTNASLEKKDDKDLEYICISVILSRTSKMAHKSATELNDADCAVKKTCEARTYCANVAVSGTFSNKLRAITKIVNEIIEETYERLMQKERDGSARTSSLRDVKEEEAVIDSNNGVPAGDNDSSGVEKPSSPSKEKNIIEEESSNLNKEQEISFKTTSLDKGDSKQNLRNLVKSTIITSNKRSTFNNENSIVKPKPLIFQEKKVSKDEEDVINNKSIVEKELVKPDMNHLPELRDNISITNDQNEDIPHNEVVNKYNLTEYHMSEQNIVNKEKSSLLVPSKTITDNNIKNKINEKKDVLLDDGAPSLCIQNKTYISFSGFQSSSKNSCEAIKIVYSDKSTSNLDKIHHFSEIKPSKEEYKHFTTVAPSVNKTESTAMSSEVRKDLENMNEDKTLEMSAHYAPSVEKKEVVVKSSEANKVELQNLNKDETLEQSDLQQGDSNLSASPSPEDSAADPTKPAEMSISRDSITNETDAQPADVPKDVQVQNEPVQKKGSKDRVSITVDICKGDAPSSSAIEKKGDEEYLKTPVRSSRIQINGVFSQSREDVLNILNTLLQEMFKNILPDSDTFKQDGNIEISTKQSNDKEEPSLQDRSNMINNISRKSSRKLKSRTFKASFVIADEQNDMAKMRPPRKFHKTSISLKSKSSVSVAHTCDLNKVCVGTQEYACCICPKPPPRVLSKQNSEELVMLVDRKGRLNKDTSKKSIKNKKDEEVIGSTRHKMTGSNVQELMVNKKVPDSKSNKRGLTTGGSSEKFTKKFADSITSETVGVAGVYLTSKVKGRDASTNKRCRTTEAPDICFRNELHVFNCNCKGNQPNGNNEFEVSSGESEISIDSIEESSSL